MTSEPVSTRWTFVLLGRRPGDSRYEEAWLYLFGAYRPVVEAYFRRHAPDAGTAQEWSDEFMAAWVEGSLDRADPGRGSFRAYLFTALRNFRHRAARTASRRPWSWPWARRPAEALEHVGAADATRDLFERDFARQVLTLALEKLRLYQEAQRQAGNRGYDLIRALYLDAGPERPSQRALAERLGLTEKAVERQLEKARARLREWILAEVRDTVGDEDELRAELAALCAHGGAALAELTGGEPGSEG